MRIYPLLLVPLLLGSSCTSGGVQLPPTLPPQMPPKGIYRVEWREDGGVTVYTSTEFSFIAYEVGVDDYGKPFRRLGGVEYPGQVVPENPYVTHGDGPFTTRATGMEVWAKDNTWEKKYGGRIFRLFYPAVTRTVDGVPKLLWPSEDEVTVEAVPEWPWGGTKDLDSRDFGKFLEYQTTSISPFGVYCIGKPWRVLKTSLRPGAWVPWMVWPRNWLDALIWFDGRLDDYVGGEAGRAGAARGWSNTFRDGARHRYVIIFREGGGEPDCQRCRPDYPNYNRWYRIFIEDFSGKENPDGTYTCEEGRAGYEEVRDREEISLLLELLERVYSDTLPRGEPMDPRLLPTP